MFLCQSRQPRASCRRGTAIRATAEDWGAALRTGIDVRRIRSSSPSRSCSAPGSCRWRSRFGDALQMTFDRNYHAGQHFAAGQGDGAWRISSVSVIRLDTARWRPKAPLRQRLTGSHLAWGSRQLSVRAASPALSSSSDSELDPAGTFPRPPGSVGTRGST